MLLALFLNVNAKVIDTIYVSFTKPVMLVFENNVKITPGSEDIQAIANENTVVIVALKENFEETNIFVQSGNIYYAFILKYSVSQDKYLYNFTEGTNSASASVVDVSKSKVYKKEGQKSEKEEQIEFLSSEVYNKKPNIYDIGDIKGKIYFMLLNVCIKDEMMFLKVGINNKSKIDYDIASIKFEIRTVDKRFKKASDQKKGVKTIYKHKNIQRVKAREYETEIFAIEKVVLDSERVMHVEMWEKGGNRICQFEINAKQLLNVEQL